jgi:hypothetical protein
MSYRFPISEKLNGQRALWARGGAQKGYMHVCPEAMARTVGRGYGHQRDDDGVRQYGDYRRQHLQWRGQSSGTDCAVRFAVTRKRSWAKVANAAIS